MRKKRKLRARMEAEAEALADMQTPELIEALEAEKIAAQLDAEAGISAEVDGLGDDDGTASEEAKLARLKRIIESLLFAADKPLTALRIKQLTRDRSKDRVQLALDELVGEYAHRGIVLHDVAGGYQFRTHPESSAWVQQLVAGKPVRLTRAQLETLSIIAYRQPITRPEIDDIRGVDSGGTLRILLERGLIRVLGKKEEPGRPLLYGTTSDFLEFFNLNQLRDLPTLREYHELTEDSMREVERLGVDLGNLADQKPGDDPPAAVDDTPATVEEPPATA